MASTAKDFDFLFGNWQVAHRRLKDRLSGCAEWEFFEGTSTTRPILGGRGNIEDNVLLLPDGPYRAAALRAFDAASGTWSIWWLDGRTPGALDVPVTGAFEAGVGTFLAKDVYRGMPILVRFLWSGLAGATCTWEQAFSPDDGRSWETNWVMQFSRAHRDDPERASPEGWP